MRFPGWSDGRFRSRVPRSTPPPVKETEYESEALSMIDARRLAARRNLALVMLRILALALGMLAVFTLVYPVVRGMHTGGIEGIFAIWKVSWLGYAAASGIIALLLVFTDRRLARWLIPVPRLECPQCGYAIRYDKPGTCPECGLVMGDDPDRTP
jgi:hypothetical protein